jgi:hypothetical protein
LKQTRGNSGRAYAGSALSEIKGVTRVKASQNAVMALLKDDQFNNRWVYRTRSEFVAELEAD